MENLWSGELTPGFWRSSVPIVEHVQSTPLGMPYHGLSMNPMAWYAKKQGFPLGFQRYIKQMYEYDDTVVEKKDKKEEKPTPPPAAASGGKKPDDEDGGDPSGGDDGTAGVGLPAGVKSEESKRGKGKDEDPLKKA